MPYLMLQTNINLDSPAKEDLLKLLSGIAAEELGKPERYVMLAIRDNTPMLFGGSDAPLAYLEMKSIGLAEEITGDLSAALCKAVHENLNIDKDRIYIEFADAPRKMWGWDGSTF